MSRRRNEPTALERARDDPHCCLAYADQAEPFGPVFREISANGCGRTWFVAIPRHNNTGRADLRAHLFQGKKYRLRVVAVDEAGETSTARTARFKIVRCAEPRQRPLGRF